MGAIHLQTVLNICNLFYYINANQTHGAHVLT